MAPPSAIAKRLLPFESAQSMQTPEMSRDVQSPSVLACEVTGLISCSPQCSGRCGSNCSTSPVSLWEACDTLQVVASKISYGPDQIQAAQEMAYLACQGEKIAATLEMPSQASQKLFSSCHNTYSVLKCL